MLLGSRVVRGPDWKWGDQDGGEGHVGTVISILSEYEEELPLDKATVEVCWDSGNVAAYSVSVGQRNYDLRLLDSSPSGVTFTDFECDGCGVKPILGLCWVCNDCSNYCLCSTCYMEDHHYLDHNFVCKLHEKHQGHLVGKRSQCDKYQARGIFPGAHVTPRDNDTPLGIGIVVDISEIVEETHGKCGVCWEETAEDVSIHNLGLNGQVELMVVESSNGPMYYRDHLPLVQMDKGQLYVGDYVCIHRIESVNVFSLETAQKLTAEIGKVNKIDYSDGSVSVKYDGLGGEVWRYPVPSLLSKTPKLSKDDAVRLTDNIQALQKLQTEKHKGFHPDMKENLNAVGIVLESENGTAKVSFPRRVWWINPAALDRVDKTAVVGQVFKELKVSVDSGVEKVGDFLWKTVTLAKSGWEDILKSAHQETVNMLTTGVLDTLEEERVRRTSEVSESQYSSGPRDNPDSSDVYRMKSDPRGLLVIINIQKFVVDPSHKDKVQLERELTERKSSEKDFDELNYLFSRYLNFKVCNIIDKPRKELLGDLRTIAENFAYKDFDCLAVCIMSHGKDDKFYAYDGNTIKVSAVCNMFSNSNCEVFRNKPKLFFIQACRGERGGGFLDVPDGPTGNDEGSSAQVPSTESKDLDMADMLIAYSSFEGYTSYRHKEEGSHFIQSLVSVFREYADKEDIMRMMTRVSSEVYKCVHRSSCGRTQVPAPTPTLRKLLYFWPGTDFGEGP